MKRLISILLVLLMTVSVLPLSLAAENSITDGALTWSYDETTKTLTVSGEGDMPDYEWIEPEDWKDDNMRLPKEWTRAEHVVVEEGITSIGDWAFMRFGAMSDISLPETLTKIGQGAFEYTYLDYIEFPASLCELEGCFWSSEPPKVIIFKGDAPNLDNWTDFSITVTFEKGDLTTIYYPKENTTWTDDVKAAFGPRIAWNSEIPPEPTAADVFDDIKTEAWYYESVQYVYERGFMIGTTPHTFAPNAELTRAQAIQMLFNMSGEDPEDYKGETKFKDISANAWCAPAINWAVEHSITSGISNIKFAPNRHIMRQELASMIHDFGQYLGDNSIGNANLSVYEDANEIYDYADTAMEWCVDYGIISGMSDTVLAPQAYTTRAQTARMLGQFHKHVLKYMPVTVGAYPKLVSFIKEKGELTVDSALMTVYTYTLVTDTMTFTAECTNRGDNEFIQFECINTAVGGDVNSTSDYKEYVTFSRIDRLEYAYRYRYHRQTPTDRTSSVGDLTPDGFVEWDGWFSYDKWDGNYYVHDEENQHIGMEKRDAMLEQTMAFIEQLLSECGATYSELFIDGDIQ